MQRTHRLLSTKWILLQRHRFGCVKINDDRANDLIRSSFIISTISFLSSHLRSKLRCRKQSSALSIGSSHIYTVCAPTIRLAIEKVELVRNIRTRTKTEKHAARKHHPIETVVNGSHIGTALTLNRQLWNTSVC